MKSARLNSIVEKTSLEMEFTFALHDYLMAFHSTRQKEKLPTIWSGAFYPALSYFCLAAIFGVRELNFWVKLRHDFECPVHTIRFFYALYIGAGYHLSSIRLAYVCPKSAPICAPTFILPVPGIGIILHFWTDTAIRERSSGFETGNWSFPEDGEIPRL